MGPLRATPGLTRSSLLAGLASLVVASACDNRVSLGLLPPSPDGGMDAPVEALPDASVDVPVDAPVDASADMSVDAAADGSPDGLPASVWPWTATFEPNPWSEWSTPTIDVTGGPDSARGSRLNVTSTMAHGGQRAAMLTLTTGDTIQYARFFRQGRFPKHARIGAWFYFPQAYTIDNYWNLIQFSVPGKPFGGLLWDIDLFPAPDGMSLVLYDHVKVAFRKPSRLLPFPTKAWVHIEVDYVSSTGTDGSIALYVDGALLVKADQVTTTFDENNLQISIGSQAPGGDITPSPVISYLDDVTIAAVP